MLRGDEVETSRPCPRRWSTIGLSPKRLGWDRGNWARARKQVGSFRCKRTEGWCWAIVGILVSHTWESIWESEDPTSNSRNLPVEGEGPGAR